MLVDPLVDGVSSIANIWFVTRRSVPFAYIASVGDVDDSVKFIPAEA